jgi:hypothetical protein
MQRTYDNLLFLLISLGMIAWAAWKAWAASLKKKRDRRIWIARHGQVYVKQPMGRSETTWCIIPSEQVKDLIRAGQKIPAVKALREDWPNLSLQETKKVIEVIQFRLR